MDFNVEQINEAFTNLPRILRRAIRGVNVAEAIEEIGKKYKLHIDALGILETRVNWVLIGLIKTRDLYMTLRENLGMESSKVNQIIKDLNKKIFRPVREEYKSLKDLEEYRAELEETEEQKNLRTEEPAATAATEVKEAKADEIPTPALLDIGELEKKEKIILRQTGVEITVPTAVGTEPEKGRLGKEEKKVLEETGMKLGRGEPIKIPTSKEEKGLDREKILAGIELPAATEEPSSAKAPEGQANKGEKPTTLMPQKPGLEEQQQKLIKEAKERGYEEHDPYREEIG